MGSLNRKPIDYRRQLGLPAMTVIKQKAITSARVLVVAQADAAEFLIDSLCRSGVSEIIVYSAVGFELDEEFLDHSCPDSKLQIHRFSGLDELESIIEEVDIVCETLLDWQLKLGLSDRCMRLDVPLIHSGVVGHRYQCYCMVPGKSACLRCALPQAGIEDFPLGQTPAHPLLSMEAWAGAIMALDVLKQVADFGVLQVSTLWRFDPLSGDREAIRNLKPAADCPDCGVREI